MKMNMMGQNVAGINVAGINVAGQGFMPGAVAINGSVGVMEIRRPQVNMDLLPSVDDVMNSVAAVAAEIAENAHITLRDCIDLGLQLPEGESPSRPRHR